MNSTFTIDPSLALPVLEPLSQATESTLAPIPLYDHDYLEIELDDEGKRFIVQATALRAFDPQFDKEEDAVQVNGSKMVKDRRGPSGNAAERWQKRVPERKGGIGSNYGYGRWILAATDYTVLVIHHVWLKERLLFKTEEAKLVYEYLLKRFLFQTKSAHTVARFKVNSEVPVLPEDYVPHPERPLADFQKVALAVSLNQEGKALFMEQGTGKTPVVIARVCLEGSRKRAGKLAGVQAGMYRALIICPRQVRLNWQVEFERFATSPGKTVVLRGGQVERVKRLVEGIRQEADCHWSACVASVDSVERMWEALAKVPWDLVVVDESHYIKSWTAKRTKAVVKFTSESKARCRMALTGTPLPNTIFDLYAQLEFLGVGLSGFTTFGGFRSFHGSFKKREKGASSIQKFVGIKGIPLIQERLARLAFMIRKEEANLGLPDKVYDIIEVQMTQKQTEFYNKLSTEMAVEIEEMLDSIESGSKSLTVNHILTMLLRLAQITSGHVKWDEEIDPLTEEVKKEGRVEQIDSTNPKVEAIIEEIRSETRDPRAKTIVWAHFVEDIRILSAKLAECGIEHVGYHGNVHKDFRAPSPEEAVRRFNESSTCKVFLGNPASGGTGLNIVGYDVSNPERFDTFADMEIFMSCNWNAAQRSQAEDRAHRRGTRNPVRVVDLVVPGTIDEEIRARVAGKRQTALAVQDVRDILKRVLSLKPNGD